MGARLDGWQAHVRPEGELLRGPNGVDLAMTPLLRRPGWRVVPVFTDPALAMVVARPALPAAVHLDHGDPARAASRIARRLLPTAELAAYVRRLDLLLDAVSEAASRSGRAEQHRNGQRLSGDPVTRRTDRAGVEFVRDYAAAWPYLDYVLDHAAPVLDRIRLLAPGLAVRDPSLWMPLPALRGMRELVLEGRELRGAWADGMSVILADHPRGQEVRDRAKRLRAKDARPLLDRLDAYQADFAVLARAVAIPAEHTHRGLHTPHVLGWEWALAHGPSWSSGDRYVRDLLRHQAPLTVLATASTPSAWSGALPGTAVVARTDTGTHVALHVRPDETGETTLWHSHGRTLASAVDVLRERFNAEADALTEQGLDAGARLVRPGLTPLTARPAPHRATPPTASPARPGRRR